jgi:hypothetical protein
MFPRAWLAMSCVLHASAFASPRSDPTQSRAVFTGATSKNASAIEVNPAALGLGDPNELYLAATATLDHISIASRTLDINSGALAPGDQVSANLLSPGGTLGGVYHPGGRFTLGVALHSSPAEQFIADSQALRYHVLGGSHRGYAGTFATSVRLSNRFYFGASVSLRSSFLRLRFARDTALAAARDPARGVDSDCGGAPCGIENPAATELYDVDVRSKYVALDNVVGTIGVTIRLAKTVLLGVAYHTPPGLTIQNELTGTMEIERAPRDGGGTITGGGTVYLSQPASVDAELSAQLPADLELHVGLRWEDLSRLQMYDVRGYGSFFPGAGIPEWQPRARGFHDSFAMWAGVEQLERDFPLIAGGRIGFETSSLADERTSPLTIAPASATIDAGLQYRLTRDVAVRPQVILQLTYGLQYFPTVDVADSDFDPRAQLSCYDSGFDYSTSACAAVRDGYAIATAAGEYSRIQQAMRVALRLTW